MSCVRLSPTITASAAETPASFKRRFEDARVRLHVAVLRRRNRHVDEAVELEVLLERIEAAVRIGNQSDLNVFGRERLERRRHVLVEQKVLTQRPFLIDLRGAWLHGRPAPPIARMMCAV